MPALILCGRRWAVGSDDFLLPALVSAVFRAIWIFSLGVVALNARAAFDCPDHFVFELYIFGSIAVFSLSVIAATATGVITMRGTILDTHSRWPIAYLLLLQEGLLVLEIVWTSLGTYWVYREPSACVKATADVLPFMRGLVVSNWIVLGCVLCGLLVAFQCIGGTVSSEEPDYIEVWESRLSYLSCCSSSNAQTQGFVFQNAAQILTNLFVGIDVVPTDVAAGLVLLRAEQTRKREEDLVLRTQSDAEGGRAVPARAAHSLHATPSAADFDLSSSSQLSDLRDAAYFTPFMLAVYGWPLYTYMKMKDPGNCGCCGIVKCCVCGSCENVDTHPPTVSHDAVGDNCCNWNTAALLRVLQPGADIEVVYTSYSNKALEPCYCVVLDHGRKRAIISIRGTLSVEDALTDAVASPEPMAVPVGSNVPESDSYAHCGILRAAKWLHDDLARHYSLEVLTNATDFSLHILGHSLGAGVASLLAFMMRPAFPNLRCWAYSPPALLSRSLALAASSFTVSIVLGDDVVPRLNEANVQKLRDDMMGVLTRAKRAKWVTFCGSSNTADTLLYNEDVFTNLPGDDDMADSLDAAEAGESRNLLGYTGLTADKPRAPPMFPPGKVLHLIQSGEEPNCCGGRMCTTSICCSNTPLWDAVWSDVDDFNEVLVSPDMVLHHLPDTVAAVLCDISDRYAAH